MAIACDVSFVSTAGVVVAIGAVVAGTLAATGGVATGVVAAVDAGALGVDRFKMFSTATLGVSYRERGW